MKRGQAIPYGCQFIDDSDVEVVTETLKSSFLTQGPRVEEFEEKLAAFCGSKYAVTFSSGTAALHGAYFVAGLGEGDSFVTTPNTFLATANAGIYVGATPLFGDVDSQTGNLTTDRINEEDLERASLVVPVHFGGQPVDLDSFEELATSHRLKVIEDGCHALGATYGKSKIGGCQYSDMTTFSFHPVKHITTGEGGAVTTNDFGYVEQLKEFRSHGVVKDPATQEENGSWTYEMRSLGFNYRMSDLQAALGITQLSKLRDFVERRQEIASCYDDAFAGHPDFETPPKIGGTTNAYHLYPIRLNDPSKRRTVYEYLRQKNILTQVHYIPVHTQPFYRERFTEETSLPLAEEYYARELSLPIFPNMTEEQLEYVVQTVLETFKNMKSY